MPADTQRDTGHSGIIAWFAGNHVAANLLMLIIIVAGLISAYTIKKETNPPFNVNIVQISVPYLGAAPQEVEEGVILKVEDAIQDVRGIKRISSTATEGRGNVSVELNLDANINDVLNEIKSRVDGISSFPALAEQPVFTKVEFRNHVIFIAIYGDMSELERKMVANEVREDLLRLPAINEVEFLGDRAYEISIEVSEATLRKFGLTMSEISEAINSSAVDMPGGTIRSTSGDILLRTKGQVYTGVEYRDVVLRTFADGTRLTLGDIATINDGFEETDGYGRFDGKRTATLRVFANGNQGELETAAAVRDFVQDRASRLPEGVRIDTWIDLSHYLIDRLDMMIKNIWTGALLVFIVLSLFLRMKVAGWVIIGIPVTFLGALWLMPLWPISVNMLSLFGFIMVLGIVVDDAIIIGESIYTKIRADGHNLDNVVAGAHRVAVPATFGVLTTIAAFAPMLFVGGPAGPFFEAMALVVVLCLAFSLVESKLILPAHLARARISPIDEEDLFNPQRKIGWFERVPRFFAKLQRRTQHGLHYVIENVYRPLLRKAIHYRGITVTLFFSVLLVTFGALGSGQVRFVLFPDLATDFVQVNLEMESGTAPAIRDEAAFKVEQAILDLNAEFLDANPDAPPMIEHLGVFSQGDTGGLFFAELPKDLDRQYELTDIETLWRERVGEIPGVRELVFSSGNNIGGGAALSFRLSGADATALEAAAGELERELATYSGIFDIRNSSASGSEELRLSIKPEAEALGLTVASLGRQVRQAFYGEEAQRIQRGRDELKVMIRYPLEERRSVADLRNMRIRTPSGAEVPFDSVAEVSFGRGYSRIFRQDRERSITVSAEIDAEIVQPNEVITEVRGEFMPQLLARYPGVKFGLEGASEEEAKFLRDILMAMVAALFLIYALIAIPLRSYEQPLIIMSAIPFGLIGAVTGHLLLNEAVSMFSMFGIIALSGVVVNDSLIMVDFINKARERGMTVMNAVLESGAQRFRAIVLTSVTTAAGLTPILLEKSVQAQFVIPTAISISFGIMFATVITLFLIPAMYVLQLDVIRRIKIGWNLLLGRPTDFAPVQ